MEVIYHRRIQKDIRAALAFYEDEGGNKLGDRFFAEAEETVGRVIQNPQGFHFVTSKLRRASFDSFPYHFLYEEEHGQVRFLVLRHDKRHPNFGLRRR
ncbi:type II toxin-antitoxin system RelE/ParE family toxin [Luteolibacter pohnpeiensis]|uniref:Type II toxin-antitoxin system RelE/ParE family toxin n=1 Tax=Luteolibacter pohnpeiensis TaxID=454153 RepID=A0A934S9K0_9BACT|nr:type II toxin-antitoxin system RelE/ParE family toxin [Luteolibacter pohnpeiensis]